jgi:hypothetical protein
MPRHHYDRQALRCAYQIQATLQMTRQAMYHDQARWVMPVVEQLPQLARASAQLARSASHPQFTTAPRIATERFLRQLHSAMRDMSVLRDQIVQESCPPTPALRDLLGELDQLESEFGAWTYDHPVSELSVTTEPIRLEGIDLGPFQIRLRMGQPITQLMGRLCWVEALEPNPAAGNSEVTHPHVSGEAICVGDHGPEMIRALRSGRLCDFFLMNRAILTTYNTGSPYVALDDWYGEPCSDCGRSIAEDDRHTCNECDREVCDDCISSCQHCDTTICHGCVTMCSCCKESSCADCLAPCDGCSELVCNDCFEEGLCPDCLENQHDEQEDNEDEEEIDTPETQPQEATTTQPHHPATTPS